MEKEYLQSKDIYEDLMDINSREVVKKSIVGSDVKVVGSYSMVGEEAWLFYRGGISWY